MASVVPARVELSIPHGREATASAGRARFYLAELDVVRFAAFMWVFYVHISISFPATDTTHRPRILWSGLYSVDLFFTLSAYLIAQLLIRELAQRGEIDVRAFYVRRVLRIWPLYFSFVAAAFILSTSFRGTPYASSFAVPSAYFIGFLVFLGNFAFVRHSSPVLVVTMLWTLSIEEQLYVLFPWIIRRPTPRAVVSAGGALVLIANLARIYFAHRHSSGMPVWFHTFTHLDAFGYGIILAAAPRALFVAMSKPKRIGALAIGLGCWLFAINLYNPLIAADSPLQEVVSYAVAMLGCGFLLIAALGMFKAEIKHPLMRFLTYAGKISYGLYVYHGLALTLTLLFCSAITLRSPADSQFVQLQRQSAGAAISFALTLAMAAASYKWLETPFLKLKERFAVIASRPV